jgi:hypothetical protein
MQNYQVGVVHVIDGGLSMWARILAAVIDIHFQHQGNL